jgi:hypothetical protein
LGSQPGSPKSQKDGEGDGDGDRPGSSASAAAKEPEVVIVPRAKVDRWLSDLEYDVRNLLREGKALEQEQIEDIIREQVNSKMA